MDKKTEYEYITDYIDESCFDSETCRDQLRCLWTAHCLHHDIDVDTGLYDYALMELWCRVALSEEDTADWGDYESFDKFMGEYLV